MGKSEFLNDYYKGELLPWGPLKKFFGKFIPYGDKDEWNEFRWEKFTMLNENLQEIEDPNQACFINRKIYDIDKESDNVNNDKKLVFNIIYNLDYYIVQIDYFIYRDNKQIRLLNFILGRSFNITLLNDYIVHFRTEDILPYYDEFGEVISPKKAEINMSYTPELRYGLIDESNNPDLFSKSDDKFYKFDKHMREYKSENEFQQLINKTSRLVKRNKFRWFWREAYVTNSQANQSMAQLFYQVYERESIYGQNEKQIQGLVNGLNYINYFVSRVKIVSEKLQKVKEKSEKLGFSSILELPYITYINQKEWDSVKDDIQRKLSGYFAELLLEHKLNNMNALSNHNLHDVILPYRYNEDSDLNSNQIDNIFITSKGIYCFEVKTVFLKEKVFDYSQLLNRRNSIHDANEQIKQHKMAILDYILKSNINLPTKIRRNLDKYIHCELLIVDRSSVEQDFKIINNQEFENRGQDSLDRVINLNEVDDILFHGTNDFDPELIDQIYQLLNGCSISEKKYKNPLFFGDDISSDSSEFKKKVQDKINDIYDLSRILDELSKCLDEYAVKNNSDFIKENILDSVAMGYVMSRDNYREYWTTFFADPLRYSTEREYSEFGYVDRHLRKKEE